ncbi:hypothetical protein PGT21_034837 [Puccinia graminis f. sp. tritici]|uniref:Uncharacterized protein n=2 Tax=Puccinia graminis f. sp. tritici TaxID=56615 RepID=A0A5B0M7Z2_PUCGR|nr:hypothetical protein PGT21_034837 [Puccinia graminis f. sp. tritici]
MSQQQQHTSYCPCLTYSMSGPASTNNTSPQSPSPSSLPTKSTNSKSIPSPSPPSSEPNHPPSNPYLPHPINPLTHHPPNHHQKNQKKRSPRWKRRSRKPLPQLFNPQPLVEIISQIITVPTINQVLSQSAEDKAVQLAEEP